MTALKFLANYEQAAYCAVIMHNVKLQTEATAEDAHIHQVNMPVGDILRRTRLHYKQSLNDVERSLRIRAEQLEAIEDGRTDLLPGRVYAIGFVRSYAEHLGLDGDKIVNLYKRQHNGWATKPDLEFPVAASESILPPFWTVLAGVLGVIILGMVWWIYTNQDKTALDIPPAPVIEQKQVEQQPPPLPQQSEISATAAPVAPAQPQGIILHISANSWVEIRDSAKDIVLVSRVLKAGEKYFVPDLPNLTFSAGNAGGIEVEINDHKLGLMGKNGEVLQNIPLSIFSMEERFPNVQTPTLKQAPPAQDAPIVQED